MKKSLQSSSLLVLGMLFVSACSEEQIAQAPERIVQEIEVEQEELVKDSIPLDTIVKEEPIVAPPPPPAPLPPNPWPEPDPWPPEPEPDPIVLPEPPPPMPIQVNPIVDFPEVEAKYPGGDEALMKFISSNIEYPIMDLEAGNQGRVFVEFIVEKDGSLSNIKVLRGVSASIDREAKRVVRLLLNWEPAESQGVAVRSRMRLPLKFQLD